MSMKLDPELMKQLIQVFRSELDEKLQSLTEGLLRLEKGLVDAEYEACLDQLFRDAHNIKGAARGVDITAISEISHGLETLFSILKKDKLKLNASMVDLCLLSLDHMREAMAAFESQTDVPFDLPSFLAELNSWVASVVSPTDPAANNPSKDETSTEKAPNIDESVTIQTSAPPSSEKVCLSPQGNDVTRVSLDKLERVSALVEALLATKIEMQDHVESLHDLHKRLHLFSKKWATLLSAFGVDKRTDLSLTNQKLFKQATDDMMLLCTNSQHIYKQVGTTNNRITHTVGSLHDQVRLMRLVPVASLLRPLERSVRDIAKELGKLVEYQVIGDDIEIDRPVLAGLKDPLVHLLRNAIDHGIEMPAERISQGKAENGSIRVTVSAIGSRVNLCIEDDGAGISMNKILETAVRKNILSVAEAELLSDDEKLNLIFRPGFSIKEIITNVSGRGVGLDVVLSGITAMKGTVQVQTEVGKGTKFFLSLPLTLSTDRGLMVLSSGTVYTIPTSVVTRVMDINPSDLVDIQAGQAVIFKGKAIPAYDLASLLNLEVSIKESSKHLSVVIISKDWKEIALLVDEVVGERELVIKRLQPPLISVRNVAGGTLTGNGKIVVVLNPADLINTAMQRQTAVKFRRGQSAEEGPVEKRHILVVDDSITTRTLEKNILEAQGYQVTVAVNGKDGWDELNKGAFDLIVTDIEMPEMNGFELAERIKTSEAYQKIPVVIVTSLASDADRRRGIEVGADAYIVKGQFETKALLDVIHQLI